MKYLLIVLLLSAAAFGQNAYGADFLNLHCTAPDASAPPGFGDTPKPGLVPTSAANGNAVLYCDAVTSSLKVSFSGGAYAGVGGGSGTVNANSGNVGALTFYPAAGGSTTVGPDTLATDNGTSLTYTGTGGVVASGGPLVSGTIATGATGAGNITGSSAVNSGQLFLGSDGNVHITRNGNNHIAIIAASAVDIQGTAGTTNTGSFSPSGNIIFTGGKGQHFQTQAANNDASGVCSGTTTTCAVTFTSAYTSTPSCVLTPTTAGVTSFIITTQANTGFTVTYAPTGTTNFNYICMGDPN